MKFNFSIDSTHESGRYGRLINHSKKNKNLVTKILIIKGIPKLILFANKDIEEGSELLYDYGERCVFVYK